MNSKVSDMNGFGFFTPSNFILLIFHTALCSGEITTLRRRSGLDITTASTVRELKDSEYVCSLTGLPGRGYFLTVDLGKPYQKVRSN